MKENKGNTSILVIGDFNDEPFNRSITDHALSTMNLLKVELSNTPRLHNLMWPLMGKGFGTFYFNNFPNSLDQFMTLKGVNQGEEF